MSRTKALVLVVTGDVLLNMMEDMKIKTIVLEMVYIHFLPSMASYMHRVLSPLFGDTEGALGGTSYHPCVADLRRKEERPRLALSYSRGIHKRMLGLTKQSKVNLNLVHERCNSKPCKK